MASSIDLSTRPINLLRGWPGPTLLPASELAQASQNVLTNRKSAAEALSYGPDAGYSPLREEVARWLGKFYGPWQQKLRGATPSTVSVAGDVERITISGGASQSIACILQSYTDPSFTQAVWMVAPCYFLACPIFEDSGFEGRLRAVPEDDEGIDLTYLENGIKAIEEEAHQKRRRGAPWSEPVYKDPRPYRKIYRHVVYAVPTFSNPSGKSMSLERRKALVELARNYDALVITDDVYDMLQWPTLATNGEVGLKHELDVALLPRLVDIDALHGPSSYDPPGLVFGHAVSNGSFSKLTGPGVRTGWTESSPDFAAGLAQTGSTRSGGAPSQLAAAIIYDMMRSKALDMHIATLCVTLGRRWRAAMGAIRRVLGPLGVRVRWATQGTLSRISDVGGGEEEMGIAGGYFIWLSFPPGGPSGSYIAQECREREGLVLGPGKMFEVHGDEKAAHFTYDMRICFAWEREPVLIEGVERLGRVLVQLRKETGGKDADDGEAERMAQFK